MINLLKSSLESELDSFFQAINGWDIARTVVTDSAFCQARKKLKFQAFVELTQELVCYFYKYFQPRLWQGFRLLSIDGSTLRLPKIADITEHFGGVSKDGDCPLARVSQLYDLRNKLTVDAVISPHNVGERELAITHMKHLNEKDFVLLDRGYAAFWIFALIRAQPAHFCARLNIDQWAVVHQFYRSGLKESIQKIYPSYEAHMKCQKYNLPFKPMEVRLIRVELANGEVEILMTSHLNSAELSSDLFGDLYHERWGIEENYEVMKHRQQMENWTGKSVDSIYQDFYARILTYNLTASLVYPVQEELNQEDSKRVYSYQVNFTKALSSMKNSIVLLFVRSSIQNLIHDLMNLFRQKPEPIRPGRHNPRKRKIRNRQTYSFVMKQTS